MVRSEVSHVWVLISNYPIAATMATEDKLNDYDFTGTDAGASHTIPSEAGQIRKGGYIVIKGHPCKVR